MLLYSNKCFTVFMSWVTIFYNCSTALLNVDCYYGGIWTHLQKSQNRFSFSLVNALISLSHPGIPNTFLLCFWIFTALQSYELMLIVLGLFFFFFPWRMVCYLICRFRNVVFFFLAFFSFSNGIVSLFWSALREFYLCLYEFVWAVI